MKTHKQHRVDSPKKIAIAVFTISSSRFRAKKKTNQSGTLIINALKNAGHDVLDLGILDDDSKMITTQVMGAVRSQKVNAVILTGGTGLAIRDVTTETLAPLFEKTIPGFGEIFRYESYRKIGTAAYLSRATAGIISGKPVFCLPGSPEAVALGMKLIIPEISHTVFIAKS
ncbi:MAG: MogA/MoaB family molybdenum cofactor biosynthesis protein [Thaumarchaeota archaeon]|nr:MogA/MoaB family molybdenum cofactor biosynthesis protein [Nitrososphaerota archaeon]